MSSKPDRHLRLVVTDAAIAALAFFAALRIRFGSEFRAVWEGDIGLPPVLASGFVLSLVVVAAFWAGGVYRTERFWSLSTEARAILRAMFASMLALMAALYFFRFQEFSRVTLALFVGLTASGVLLARWLLRRVSGSSEVTRVLIAGTDGVERILDRLARHPEGHVSVVGYVGHDSDRYPAGNRLGDLGELPNVLASQVVDEVIVCLPVDEWEKLDAIAGVCEQQGKVMRVPVDVVSYALRRGHVEDLDGVPMLSLVSTPANSLGLILKRSLDVLISITLIVLLLPFHLIVSMVILATDGRPVLFRQVRAGHNGRSFYVLKYRTMTADAEERKPQYASRNERVGPAFKLTDDPRITKTGRWMRRASIDELPQLWNVLLGEMSLVGPRPQPIEEVAEYDPWHRRRLSVRPGITGLWQVTSRNDPSFDNWVDLDLAYIDSWSLWSDLKILARTPFAIFTNPGI